MLTFRDKFMKDKHDVPCRLFLKEHHLQFVLSAFRGLVSQKKLQKNYFCRPSCRFFVIACRKSSWKSSSTEHLVTYRSGYLPPTDYIYLYTYREINLKRPMFIWNWQSFVNFVCITRVLLKFFKRPIHYASIRWFYLHRG